VASGMTPGLSETTAGRSNMTTIDAETRLCGVIGDPVEHSLSPHMHNAAFQAKGLNYVYLAFRIRDVQGCLAGMRAMPSFRGLSVTIPHKRAVMPHLDEIEPMASHVGSVNTITNENGRLVGSTTDGPGALQAFRDAGVSLDGKRVLFLGTGGAVRAVAFAVAEMTAADGLTILGRTRANVSELVGDISDKTPMTASGGSLESDLEAAMGSHDVVIQGTPVGMYPEAGISLVPPTLFRSEQAVFDMVYRPAQTQFLRDAHSAGCTTIQGIEMLIGQAVLQFERWTGETCPVDVMRGAALQALGSQ